MGLHPPLENHQSRVSHSPCLSSSVFTPIGSRVPQTEALSEHFCPQVQGESAGPTGWGVGKAGCETAQLQCLYAGTFLLGTRGLMMPGKAQVTRELSHESIECLSN